MNIEQHEKAKDIINKIDKIKNIIDPVLGECVLDTQSSVTHMLEHLYKDKDGFYRELESIFKDHYLSKLADLEKEFIGL